MSNFTNIPTDSQYKLLIALGHPSSALANFPLLNENYPEEYVELVESLLVDLDAIDVELKAARQRAMALELEGTKVNFNNQIVACRLRGGEIVNQLSHLLGIPINWNRFGSAGQKTIVSQM